MEGRRKEGKWIIGEYLRDKVARLTGKRAAALCSTKLYMLREGGTHVIKALSSVDQYYATHAAYHCLSSICFPSASFLRDCSPRFPPPRPPDSGQIGSCIPITNVVNHLWIISFYAFRFDRKRKKNSLFDFFLSFDSTRFSFLIEAYLDI